MALTAAQLNTVFQNVLFRPAEPAAIAFYANRTDVSDAQIRQQIELSQEAVVFTNPIVRLFEAAFNRLPSQADLTFYGQELKNSGLSTLQVATQLASSAEFAARAPGGVVTAAFVQTLYQDLLNRAASPTEVAYYVARSPAQLLNGVANSPEATQAQASAVITYLDSAAQGQASTGDLDSQSGPTATTNFTLTTGADNVVGTGGSDVITGLAAATGAAATDTLTAADVINGGAGVDILNITTTATNTNATNGAQITNVEAVQIRATAGTATVNANNVPGATFFNSNVSAGNVVVQNAVAGTIFGLIGDGLTTTGSLTGQYVDTATNAIVTLASGTKGGTVDVATGAGLTTLAINSVGAANTITGLTSNANTKTVTINAASNLDLGTGISALAVGATETISGAATTVKLGTTTSANIVTIDASGLTAGGVTTALNAGVATTFAFKGGQGSDTVSIGNNFTNTLTAGSVNAGAGTDVVEITGANAIVATTGAAFTGFETLRNSGSIAQNAAVFGGGIVALQTNGATGAGFTNLSAAQAANIQVLKSNATTTFSLTDATGTADVLSLNLKNDATVNTTATDATVISATNLTVTGFETLNVAAASGVTSIFSTGTTLQTVTTGIDTVTLAAAANLKTIAVSGAFAAQIDATGAAALTSIDASANTAGVILTSGAVTGKLAITGTLGADFLTVATLGAGGSIGAIGLGGGNDTVQIAQASISSGTTIDGGAATDTLEITDTGAVTISDATFRGVTNIEKIVLDATTLTSFSVGGFANSLATANGGTLDVTDALLTGGATIDASGLTGTNKLVLNITDTGAAVSDTITTSTGGADSITIKGAHGTGAITITGGANTAGLTIDTSAATSTATTNAFTTGSGNDTIKVGDFVATITTGTGTDSVTLTGATTVQTINLNTTGVSSTTNAASVTNFSTATGTNDVLDFVTTNVQTSATLANGFTVTNGVATKVNATLADFTAAVAASTATGSAAFQLGTDTYVGYSDGSAATTGLDHLIKLVGLTGVTNVDTTATAGHIVVG